MYSACFPNLDSFAYNNAGLEDRYGSALEPAGTIWAELWDDIDDNNDMYSGNMHGIENGYLTSSLFDDEDDFDSYIGVGDEFDDLDDDDTTAQKLLDRFFTDDNEAYFGSNAGRAPDVEGYVVDGMLQNQDDDNGCDYMDDDKYTGTQNANDILANTWGLEDEAWLTEAYANYIKTATNAATTGAGAGAVVGQADDDATKDDDDDEIEYGGVLDGYLYDSWAGKVLQANSAAGRRDSSMNSRSTVSSSSAADLLDLKKPRYMYRVE